MKKKILTLILLVSASIGLSACEEDFNPFDFNDLNIISSQESFYINSEATNNLLYVSSVDIDFLDRRDETNFYYGSASTYASYHEQLVDSTITFYSNHGYINEFNTKTTLGNGLIGRYYSETENTRLEWVNKDASSPSDYLLYTVNEYNNPRSAEQPTISSTSSLFSNNEQYEIEWIKKCLDLVSDGYSYADFMYGSRDDKIYAFNQTVSEEIIKSPLVSGEDIITFTENMRVRGYEKHESLGWIISYSASRESLYYATSLSGDVYDDPLLIQQIQTIYTYHYDDITSNNFTFLQSDVLVDYQPILFTYTVNEGEELVHTAPSQTQTLEVNYLPRTDKDADLYYCTVLVDLIPTNYYLLGMIINDETYYYDSSFIHTNGNFSLDSVEHDSLEFFTSYTPMRLYLVISLLEDGSIHNVEAYYWSNIYKKGGN